MENLNLKVKKAWRADSTPEIYLALHDLYKEIFPKF